MWRLEILKGEFQTGPAGNEGGHKLGFGGEDEWFGLDVEFFRDELVRVGDEDGGVGLQRAPVADEDVALSDVGLEALVDGHETIGDVEEVGVGEAAVCKGQGVGVGISVPVGELDIAFCEEPAGVLDEENRAEVDRGGFVVVGEIDVDNYQNNHVMNQSKDEII